MNTDHQATHTPPDESAGIGVTIAPQAIGRLFTLHAYSRCPKFNKRRMPSAISDSKTECL